MPPELRRILDLLRSVRPVKETDLTADGSGVAWAQGEDNERAGGPGKSTLWIADAGTGPARRVTAGSGDSYYAERGIRWSPPGDRIAFLSDCEKPGQLQLHLWSIGAGTSRRLTRLSGQLAAPRWSPDSRWIALLYIADQHFPSGIGHPAPLAHGEFQERLFEQRLLLVDSGTGESRFASPPALHVYEFDWSPDSRAVAYTAAAGPGENNYWLARLYVSDLHNRLDRQIHLPDRQIASPRWSPDGRSVAFVHGIMSDQGMTGGDIWTVSIDGAAGRNLTAGYAGSPSQLSWPGDPRRLLFTEWKDGGVALGVLDIRTGACEQLWKGDESIGTGASDLTLAIAADGATTSVIRSSWSEPPELWVGKIGHWRRRTNLNENRRPLWGHPQKLEWSNGGHSVQGWLLHPAEVDPSRRYPMVVAIHGGPAAQSTPVWPDFGADPVLLSGQGYFVFLPNPRGSFGKGESFTAANVRDFGYGDLSDIMAGVDQALKVAPIDPGRLGVIGHSYGGFLTLWAVTQTDRFRAAVASGVIANWQSYFGQNQIDQWPVPYFGASVYAEPAIYARSSPIDSVRRVCTPTLILAGERDRACPAPQAYEFWHALKAMGVKTKLVIYSGEGHLLEQRANIEDYATRMRDWFDQNLA